MDVCSTLQVFWSVFFRKSNQKRFSLYFKIQPFSAASRYLLALQVCTFNLSSSKA